MKKKLFTILFATSLLSLGLMSCTSTPVDDDTNNNDNNNNDNNDDGTIDTPSEDPCTVKILPVEHATVTSSIMSGEVGEEGYLTITPESKDYRVNEVIQNNSKYSKGLFESAINVWCSIMMIYKLPISPDQFQTILENFPPDPNSVNLEYASHFAVYAINNLQNIFPFEKFVDTAINIFSSNDFILRSINIEEASLLANLIKTSSPESLNDHSDSDERNLMNLQQHIQRF